MGRSSGRWSARALVLVTGACTALTATHSHRSPTRVARRSLSVLCLAATTPPRRNRRSVIADHLGVGSFIVAATTGAAPGLGPQTSSAAAVVGRIGYSPEEKKKKNASNGLQAARELSDADFYVAYPYRTASDVVPFVEACAARGSPDATLAALELWADRYPAFQLGPTKGKILDDAVRRARPRTALEIGSFVGYSAVRIARLLPEDGRLFCVEASPDFADVAQAVVRHAGLDATFVVARASDAADELARQVVGASRGRGEDTTSGGMLDLVFLDHAKEAYADDLRRLETTRLVRPGTVVVADNVVYPGAPGYLDHVAPPRYQTRLVPAPFEARGWETNWEVRDDAVAVSVCLSTEEETTFSTY